MNTVIKRIKELDKDLLSLLFIKSGEGKNISPVPVFFSDPNNILLVAYSGEIPAGFLYAYIFQDLKTPYPKLFLYSIDVFVGFRRKKIATELIGQLKNIASSKNCSEIFVLTDKNNKPAMNLYKTTGGKIEDNDAVLFVYDCKTFK